MVWQFLIARRPRLQAAIPMSPTVSPSEIRKKLWTKKKLRMNLAVTQPASLPAFWAPARQPGSDIAVALCGFDVTVQLAGRSATVSSRERGGLADAPAGAAPIVANGEVMTIVAETTIVIVVRRTVLPMQYGVFRSIPKIDTSEK